MRPIRALLFLTLTVGLGGCGRSGDTAPPATGEADPTGTAVAGEVPAGPAPGADIVAVPVSAPGERAPADRVAVAPVELGSDRPVVSLPVPTPPPGTTTAFTFDDGRRGWVARLPAGVDIPTPAYGDGRLYVSAGFETSSFYALDAKTGHVLWTRNTLEDDGPTAPMYADDQVIFNTESCTLFVLDASTGRTLWSRYLGDPTLAQPTVAEGLVFAGYPPDSGRHRFGAFRLGDGKPVWSSPVDGELLAAPVIAGDSVYLSTVRGSVYRHLRKTGERLWRAPVGASSPPWAHGDELFLSRTDRSGEEQIVLSVVDGELSRVVRRVDVGYLGEIPRSTSNWKKVWAFEGARPVVLGGRRFDTMAGEVMAFDPGGDEPLWRRPHPGRAGERALTAPAVAGAKVFFATVDGDLYGLDVDTGMTVWAYGLGVKVGFQPIVADGWVYVPTRKGSVVALELGDSTLGGWHMWGGNPHHNGLVL